MQIEEKNFKLSYFRIIIVDSAPYISELLAGIEDEAVRQSVSDFLIPRSKLSVGDLIGKGNNVIHVITQCGISHTDREM